MSITNLSHFLLIQTATGGTGLIAIQLAKHYGAQIYATAGSQPKLDYLKRLGVPYQINYREMDFAEEIERLTQGRGVDVVINTLPGDAIQKGINCLAPGGRYIEIAMTALKSARMIDLSTLSQNQSFYSVDLRKLALTDLATFKGYCQEMLQLLENGIIAPTIDQVFAWERLKDAYRYIEERQNIGKIVVRIPETIQASHVVTSPQSLISATHHEPIAIIGMSGRFAHCKNVNELWEHLAHGTDLIEEVSRWDSKELAPAERREAYCKHGSFLEGIDLFDALFFNISGFEATYMDPQQRLVLEECWKALEDAGYVGTSIEGQQCGVYVGCAVGDYQRLLEDMPPAQAFWGNAGSVIPARIAYYLNLQGPAIAIDTACSSSLVAMHLACQGLWSGEIDMALAGGVFLQCTPEFYQLANRAGMLSATGHCYTFDDRADGFVPGEGVGMVVLKRLKEALASGDHIYGVIRGSSINQDGATRGITVPSANSQERLLRSVYEKFQVDPAQIQMMEAHGTGTKLGDPIEYDALTRAFRKYTEKQEYCALGSIKTNLGHTAGAAGVAGVIKILLSLQHKQIPPSLHFQSGNAHIQFKESPFYVNTRLQDWKPGVQDTEPPLGGQAQGTAPSKPQTPTLECPAEGDKARRCAAISSFGFSGTNAHMVIEEAPEQTRSHVEMPSYLIVLSARTEDQLHQQVEQLVVFLSQDDQAANMINCGNISYTLLVGRKHLKYRLTCIIRNCRELESLLREWLEKGKVPQISVSNLQQHEQSENASLKQYGNQCLKDCQSTLESVVYLARLSAIAELYLQGYTLAFELLFANSDYSRVSLPTYPFARERYWVPTATSKDSTRLLPTNSLVQNPKTFWGMGGFGDTPNPAREASPPGPPSPTTSLVKDSTRLLPANSLVQNPKTFWGMGGFGDTPNPAREASPPGPPSPTTSLVSALVSDKQTQHSLPSITQVETSFASDMSKSRPISLRPLLSVPTPANELVQQSPPPLTLPNANMILSTSHSKGQSQVAIPTEKRKSAQSLQDELILSLAGMLAVKPSDIDIDASFIDMGLDSVMGVEWIQILNNQYGLSLTATKVYDYPTIRSFAVFLWKERATCEEEVKPEKLPASSLLSLQEIMQKVQDGRLNIEQADALFHQYAKSFS
ncbi:MAG: zinc-binding dehydrogenase [Chloroflexi bacterium]|nr:MAG: zinc-binding dehydrogenase [Chloroflexota bacterium]